MSCIQVTIPNIKYVKGRKKWGIQINYKMIFHKLKIYKKLDGDHVWQDANKMFL